ncbi:SCO family protein [Cellvibrio polysaccharolyticus]|nr:SCO family protein [Cellvibrio polysaccharolyticus]
MLNKPEKNRMHSVSSILFSLALGSCISLTASADDHDAHNHDQHKAEVHHHDHKHTSLAAGEVNHHDSLYHFSANWTDQNNSKLTLNDFKGQPVIISMIYGNCRTACPVLVNDARQIIKKLNPQQQQTVKVVFVSFDAKHDTPEVLADYAEQMDLAQPNWHFLNGSASDIRTLATLLGIRYREKSDGNFDHSNILTLLDKEGRIAHRVEGLQQPAEPMIKKISALLP